MDRFFETYHEMLRNAKDEHEEAALYEDVFELHEQYSTRVRQIKRSRRRADKQRTVERRAARRLKQRTANDC